MTGLTAAHRGYEYQDLMAACRLVDVVVGDSHTVLVDQKLYTGDRFDDLTVSRDDERERTQFKHTDSNDRPLSLATFTGDTRDLRLDLLVASAAADKAGPGAGTPSSYRIVLRDARPVDARLLAVLRPASPDPGPFQPGMSTTRLRFEADTLWNPSTTGSGNDPFSFLREGARSVSREDLDWFCDHAVVEVEAPQASWDLTAPGPAETLLLDRLRTDIGTGVYPNRDRSAVDVAEAFIRLARTARQGTAQVTRDDIVRRAQLREDYGAVARSRPADPSVAIDRRDAVELVADAAGEAADAGGTVVVTAPPGHGKSWLCDALVTRLTERDWLVAEHYCYLGDADDDRVARVLADSIFGSLLARVADADPAAVARLRPLFAAGDEALTQAVASAVGTNPTRPVALVVDGLDHVTRVRNDSIGFDASGAIAEALAALELPAGSVLIVLSQPGGHLQALIDGASACVEVPGLTRHELAQLATTLRMPLGPAGDDRDSTLDALAARSGGNALYATYLCREILRDPARAENPAAALLGLPPFDGTLANYYQHLWATLEPQAWWVAEVIGLIDFAVTRDELRQINPGSAHRVDGALDALAPVLVERPGSASVRLYHESFGRFLRQRVQGDPASLEAVLGSIAAWLQARGLFDDSRAFRSLLGVLGRAGRHPEVVQLVNHDFVVDAVAAAFPMSAIKACLATAADSAAQCADWGAAVRCVELSRAAQTLQDERFESTVVPFADVVVSLVGADAVSDRLLHEGQTVMAARAGVQMCASVDRLGGVPPWREYLDALFAQPDDHTIYGEEADRAVDLAWLRGRLRLSAASGGGLPQDSTPGPPDPSSPLGAVADASAPIRWEALAASLDDGDWAAEDMVGVLADTYGPAGADGFARLPERAGPYCLAMAEAMQSGRLTGSACTARTWAWAAVSHGLPDGSLSRLMALGLSPADGATNPYDRDLLLQLTRDVQQRSVRWDSAVLPRWLDQVAHAAHGDPLGLDAAEAIIDGPGWYRCWLRFSIALERSQTVPTAARDGAIELAISLLTVDVRPFAGDPRACDLYPIHGTVQGSVRRAVAAITSDEAWERAITVLRNVGADIATTMSGELGGPLPADWMMQLTISTAPPSKLGMVRALALTQTEEPAARYYSDIAETRLSTARVELAAGAREEAAGHWRQACQLLVAYGWRKDSTVYELLDPFPELIDADPWRARDRLPKVQAICEGVWMHTDGKGTRGALARWWKLLAAADPVALVELIAPALHANCNDPDDHLHEALAELWRAWSCEADPFVVGALRLSTTLPFDPADADWVARLADSASEPVSAAGRLLASCLARLDERPPSYPYTNSDEMVSSDEVVVSAINAAIDSAPGAPAVQPLPLVASRAQRARSAGAPDLTTTTDLGKRLSAQVLPTYPRGLVGLARAVRAWQSRPSSDRQESWATDRVTNLFGYRLLELAQDGRREEASAQLIQIADGTGLGRDSDVLAALAEGFASHGEPELAAVAGTLAWTRSRGGGGWLTFGGTTRLESLRTATRADTGTALAVLGDEIARVIRSDRGGTWGVAQALILAFVTGAAAEDQAPDVDTAFACFDAALEVIAARTPNVHPQDAPDLPYHAPPADYGCRIPGDVDTALAGAAVAGLARPEREAKRRALLATEYLLLEQPAAVANGIRDALAHLSDPASLTWLLSLLTRSASPGSPALATSAGPLAALAVGPHLSVRVLARGLIDPAPALPPPEPADAELTHTSPAKLWTPDVDDVDGPPNAAAQEVVGSVAAERLAAAETLLPGLTAAVLRRTASVLNDDELKRRMQRQLGALQDRNGQAQQWPDAWLAIDESAEDALQRAAAGARSADLRRAYLRDPAAREAELAHALVDPPDLALSLEAVRLPRPAIAAPPAPNDQVWDTLTTHVGAGSSGTSFGTVDSSVIAQFSQLEDAGDGWRMLGHIEVLHSPPPERDREGADRFVYRFRGLEVREEDDARGLDAPPFAKGQLEQWKWGPAEGPGLRTLEPLMGLDLAVGEGTDSPYGLGLPKAALVPGPGLMAALRGTLSGAYQLSDRDRPLLELRIWRSLYERSDYHQPWPRLTGAALVVTREGFDRVLATAPRLVQRDFIHRGNA